MAAIEAAGTRVEPLPVYSPDLTPIEEMFSKIKAGLRTIAARSIDAGIAAMGKTLNEVTPKDAFGWFHDRCPFAIVVHFHFLFARKTGKLRPMS